MSFISKLKTFIALSIILISNHLIGQTQTCVDERFELVSIAFRLTGEKDFVQPVPANYVTNINHYFAKYKNHELIDFISKTIHSKSVLALSTISELAADIEITPKGIVFTNKWITLYNSNKYGQFDGEWSKSELKEFLRLLNKFYKDSKFHQFFITNQNFYKSLEKEFQKIVNQIDTAWFQDFFGKPFQMDNIWIVPANGYHNFAIHRKDAAGNEYNHCAIGYASTSSSENIVFGTNYFMVLIHEICHNYWNPICEQNKEQFKELCDTLYRYVGPTLEKNYYGGSLAIISEGVNRLCEYYYYQMHNSLDSLELKLKIKNQEIIGFLWFEEMLRFMEVFSSNRGTYTDFQSFVPQIHSFLSEVVNNLNHYYYPKMQLQHPQVIATYPANHSIVDTNISEIDIFFSQPMFTGMLFMEQIPDQNDVSPIPEDFDKISWENNYTYKIPLREPLKPKTKYGLRISKAISNEYHYRTKPYDLIFETK